MTQNLNKIGKIKTVALVAVMVATVGGIGIAPLVAHAANSPTPHGQTTREFKDSKNKTTSHATNGTVSAISGNTITLTKLGKKSTTTTYTIDATSAKITKKMGKAAPTVITISDIKVGDRLLVKGTITGTTISATNITDLIKTPKTEKK
jgi:hypothetical protein